MPVLEGIESQPGEGAAQFAASENGVLAYVRGSASMAEFPVVWVDRSGRSEPLWPEPGIYGSPTLSPDGKRLALSVLRDDNWDVWTYDIERGVATRLTFGEGYDADPVWSPDGRWIAFMSDREGPAVAFRKRTDGSGAAERLHEPGLFDLSGTIAWSPDGKVLVIQTASQEGGDDMQFLHLDGESRVEPFLTTPFSERDASFSPNGRWIAYVSNETGRPQVYVSTYPPGGGKWQISDEVGSQPRWSDSGRELFYRTADGVMSVQVSGEGDTFSVAKPRPQFTGPYLGGLGGVRVPGLNFPDYDVSADGQRFVMFKGNESDVGTSTANIVTGWFDELRRLTNAKVE
jgi:Tol biopolymer transport system component